MVCNMQCAKQTSTPKSTTLLPFCGIEELNGHRDIGPLQPVLQDRDRSLPLNMLFCLEKVVWGGSNCSLLRTWQMTTLTSIKWMVYFQVITFTPQTNDKLPIILLQVYHEIMDTSLLTPVEGRTISDHTQWGVRGFFFYFKSSHTVLAKTLLHILVGRYNYGM